MRALSSLIVLASAAVLAGCSTQEARYDYDRNFDFATLKTYDWHAGADETAVDESVVASVKQAVEKELMGKGIRKVSANPDFLIATRFTREVVQTEDWRSMHSRYGQYRAVYPDYMYEQGRLRLEFLQPGTNKLFWRGKAQFETEAVRLQAEMDKRAEEAVNKILRHFPPAG